MCIDVLPRSVTIGLMEYSFGGDWGNVDGFIGQKYDH